MRNQVLAGSVVSLLLLASSALDAQEYHHGYDGQTVYRPGYHVDPFDNVLRDRHGHVVRTRHHHEHALPAGHAGGSYYCDAGRYYYVAGGSRHVTRRPTQIAFGAFSHVDDLANRLEQLCNKFCLDLYYNYSHNPGFHETYTEAYQVLQVAKFIHDAEHAHDRGAIQAKLGGLDSLFHHVQDDVRHWTRHHNQQIGHLGIVSKMSMIESTLHHLMNDVGVQLTPPLQEAPAPETIPAPVAPAPMAPGPAATPSPTPHHRTLPMLLAPGTAS